MGYFAGGLQKVSAAAQEQAAEKGLNLSKGGRARTPTNMSVLAGMSASVPSATEWQEPARVLNLSL